MWRWVKRVMVMGLLLLSSGIVVLWVRSYFIEETLFLGPTSWSVSTSEIRDIRARSRYGGAVLSRTTLIAENLVKADGTPRFWTGFEYFKDEGPTSYPYLDPLETRTVLVDVRGAGFQIMRADWTGNVGGNMREEEFCIVVPFWFLLLLTGLYPAIVGFRYIRRRRREGRGFAVEVSEEQTGGGEGPQKSG